MDPRTEQGTAAAAASVTPQQPGRVRAEPAAELPFTGVVSTRDGRPTLLYQVGVLLGTLGNVIALYTPIAVGLSLKVNELVPEADRVGALSLVTGVGAFFALIANPLAGRLSDRTTWRLGRRRPWLIGGALIGLAGLILIASAEAVWIVVLGWCVTQVGFGAVMAATYATLADQVLPKYRGRIGGLIGVAVPAGMALGAWISSLFSGVGVSVMIIVPAALGAGLTLLFAFILRDRPASAPTVPFSLAQFFSSFVFNPIKYPDFAWVWLTKFLFMCAYTTGTGYTAFFLLAHLRLPLDQVAGTIALTLIASGLGTFITSPLGGWLSDRLGRRRLFVAVAAAVAMGGLVIIATAPGVPMVIAGQFVLGLGLGCFNAVDLALAADTLPDDGQAAKNLGVFNIAASLPQSLVPVMAAPIVAAAGYPGLFITGAVLGLVGAVLVYRVRGVR